MDCQESKALLKGVTVAVMRNSEAAEGKTYLAYRYFREDIFVALKERIKTIPERRLIKGFFGLPWAHWTFPPTVLSEAIKILEDAGCLVLVRGGPDPRRPGDIFDNTGGTDDPDWEEDDYAYSYSKEDYDKYDSSFIDDSDEPASEEESESSPTEPSPDEAGQDSQENAPKEDMDGQHVSDQEGSEEESSNKDDPPYSQASAASSSSSSSEDSASEKDESTSKEESETSSEGASSDESSHSQHQEKRLPQGRGRKRGRNLSRMAIYLSEGTVQNPAGFAMPEHVRSLPEEAQADAAKLKNQLGIMEAYDHMAKRIGFLPAARLLASATYSSEEEEGIVTRNRALRKRMASPQAPEAPRPKKTQRRTAQGQDLSAEGSRRISRRTRKSRVVEDD